MNPTKGLGRADAPARRICPICGCPNRPWLRLKEVSRCIGRCGRTLRRYIKAGRLDGRQTVPGGPWLIQHSSIHTLLDVTAEKENSGG